MIDFNLAVDLRRRLFDFGTVTAFMVRDVLGEYMQGGSLDSLYAALMIARIGNEQEFADLLEKDIVFKMLYERVCEYAD